MKKVLVVGDVILDEYVFGDVSRISPEAPIPVLDEKSREISFGGALNVARNIITLSKNKDDVKVYYSGFVSKELFHLLDEKRWTEYNIETISEFVADEQILKKTRFVCDNRQLLRVDNHLKYSQEHCQNYYREIFSNIKLKTFDLIVISDYNKGTINSTMYNILSHAKIPTIIETKNWQIDIWGNHIITKSNNKEPISKTFNHLTHCHITTKGKDGYTISFEKSGKPSISKPSYSKKSAVSDPCGAGDVFLAGLATSYLESGNKNFDIESMCDFANRAASESVHHFGTIAVKREWIEEKE